jgi:hypothetical protein
MEIVGLSIDEILLEMHLELLSKQRLGIGHKRHFRFHAP